MTQQCDQKSASSEDTDIERLWAEMRVAEDLNIDFKGIAEQVFFPSLTPTDSVRTEPCGVAIQEEQPSFWKRLCFWRKK